MTNVQNFGAQKKEIKTLYNCASFEIREKLKPLNELAKTFKVLEMRTYLRAVAGKCRQLQLAKPFVFAFWRYRSKIGRAHV